MYDLYNTALYTNTLCNFKLDGGIINSISRGFLNAKSNCFETQFGSCFWDLFPYFNLRTSIAIAMDQYLPSHEERLLQVIRELKKKGHACRVIDISTIEVDNKRYLMYLTSGNRVQVVRLRELL